MTNRDLYLVCMAAYVAMEVVSTWHRSRGQGLAVRIGLTAFIALMLAGIVYVVSWLAFQYEEVAP